MEVWGYESYSNDACWDALDSLEDIHDPMSNEINFCAATQRNVIVDNSETNTNDVMTFCGIVIWGLDHKCTVDREHLILTKHCAHALLNNDEHLDIWGDRSEREQHIKNEILIIEKALLNGGIGEERYVSGLIDKILERESQ